MLKHCKNMVSLIIVFCMVFGAMPLIFANMNTLADSGGSGEDLNDHLTGLAKTINAKIKEDELLTEINHISLTPIAISTPEELDAIRNDLSGHYYLMNDINLSQYVNWIPIGYDPNNEDFSFNGSLDGRGHSIIGLSINVSDTNNGLGSKVGLFNNVSCEGRVANLSLLDVNININTNDSISVGAIAGTIGKQDGCTTQEVIANCKVDGQIRAVSSASAATTLNVGGLVGKVACGQILNSYNVADIDCVINGKWDNQGNVGGIAGNIGTAIIKNCANSGYITQNNSASSYYSNAGGIVGLAIAAEIEYCFNFTFINGLHVGGIVGEIYGNSIKMSYNEGSIAGTDAGGIAGKTTQMSSQVITVIDCINVGSVSGTSGTAQRVGGAIGAASSSDCINRCNNYGSITASSGALGGIVGSSTNSSLSDCHNYGSLTNTGTVKSLGGIAGEITAQQTSGRYGHISVDVFQCHNDGIINANSSYTTAGGIAGIASNSITSQNQSASILIDQCYNSADITDADSSGGILGIEYTMFGQENPTGVSTTIRNCYNLGDICINTKNGGIVGSHEGAFSLSIEYCYNLGSVYSKSISSVNGITGYGNNTLSGYDDALKCIINNCLVLSPRISGPYEGIAYYICDGYNQTNVVRSNNLVIDSITGNASNDGATLVSSKQVINSNIYIDIGWDFANIWELAASNDYQYPILRWQKDVDSKPNNGSGGGNPSQSMDTKTINKIVTYNQDFDNGYVKVKWGAELFNRPSTEYNNDLALVAAALAIAANDGDGNRGQGRHIVDAYNTLGFEPNNIALYSYPKNKKNVSSVPGVNTTDDVFAFSIAHQAMIVNGEKVNVIAIVLRGTDTLYEGFNDYFTATEDFYGYNAYSFYKSYMDDVWLGFLNYCATHDSLARGERLKILISGHSLGGAAANLLAANFELGTSSSWASKDDIYAFSFGALNSIKERCVYNGYENIHNFVNFYDEFANFFYNDVLDVGGGPLKGVTNYEKFGRVRGFSYDYTSKYLNGSFTINHQMVSYLDSIRNNIATIDTAWERINVSCPVDIAIFNNTNTLVGSIKNNTIDTTASTLPIFVNGDVKSILVPLGQSYLIKMTGTGTGIMEYLIEPFGAALIDQTQIKTFSNVSLVSDKKFFSQVSGSIATADVQLYVIDDQDIPIATVNVDGTEITLLNNSNAYYNYDQFNTSPTELLPIYAKRTLLDQATKVSIVGMFATNARLNVKEATLHAENTCDACDEIRAQTAAGNVLNLYDISVIGSYRGKLEIRIYVGTKYNGQVLTVLHCSGKTLESQDLLVVDGYVTGTFSNLSPFAVLESSLFSATEPPQTGSNSYTWIGTLLLILLGMAILAGIYRFICVKRIQNGH